MPGVRPLNEYVYSEKECRTNRVYPWHSWDGPEARPGKFCDWCGAEYSKLLEAVRRVVKHSEEVA